MAIRIGTLGDFESVCDTHRTTLCITAVFDLTTYTLQKVFDSLSGSLPGVRWSGCHSNGMDCSLWFGLRRSENFSLLYARSNHRISQWADPFAESVTAKSLDGGATWNSDTSLTNTQAATCWIESIWHHGSAVREVKAVERQAMQY